MNAPFMLGRTPLLFLLLICSATCLAVHNPQRISKVVSTRRDGRSRTYFFHDDVKNNADSSGRPAAMGAATKRVISDNNGPLHQIQAGLRSTFLPAGFPHSTPKGYLAYSCWSWIQDLSTQLRGVLATQRILEGVGVGREGATALSALLNFLVRDGCGMAANLLFTAVASSSFSSDVKRWRIFADVMVDIGITLEVAATMVPPAFFLPMICKTLLLWTH